ncbi:helicase-associated domain-containing protein [Corynebacterium breve]|uniref:Helicase-associated domain-containing protein n=1 Tax=Corynebacterium breve TaxID=3049799 RepID=A0ABY8VIA5_9CORY|nr:helicase-associated domain-containing protein [Corynebacterium breve]WIM68348.1 helicase-associated domain-containing protein [Corynebacterium breve]
MATRLTLPGSLSRAVRTLTSLEIAVLESAGDLGAELEPVSTDAIVAKLPVASELALAAIERLRRLALLFGDQDVRVTPGALGALPQGWRVLDHAPATVQKLVEGLDRQQRAVLDTLASSGGVGSTHDAGPDADPSRPIPQLIAKELLVRVNSSTVRLPRPVRDALRGETPQDFPLTPSQRFSNHTAPSPLIDEAAAAQGLDATRTMRRIITRLGHEPVALNKDGSVGVRALSTLAKELDLEVEDLAFLITVGESAGLIGRGEIDVDINGLAPTKDAPNWVDARISEQWAIVFAGWVASPWQVGKLNGTDERGQTIRLLSESMHSPDVRRARTLVLRQFARTPGAPLTLDDVLADLRFSAPILASGIRTAEVSTIVSQAHLVGALAQHAASSALVALLNDENLAQATSALVPAEVSYVIPQADMTILAPGPLTPELQSELERFAILESPGLASVYRVNESSIRKGLDEGRQPSEIIAWLHEHSPTGVPQPMEFLINDAARGHGSIRAGEAVSYIRSEDPALITQASTLLSQALTRIAPQVAVSQLPLTKLLALLRGVGLQPTAEDGSGASISMAPEPVLVTASPSVLLREPQVDDEHIARAVSAIRDAGGEEQSGEEPGADDHVSLLQAAARAGKQVAIGYVNRNGQGNQVTVTPLSVNAGQVDALNPKNGAVVRIALPRITKVIVL